MKSNENYQSKKAIKLQKNVFNKRDYQKVTRKVKKSERGEGELIMMLILMVVLLLGLYLLGEVGSGDNSLINSLFSFLKSFFG